MTTGARDPITKLSDEDYATLADDLYHHRHEVPGHQVEVEVDPDLRSVVAVPFARGGLAGVEAAARAAALPLQDYIRHTVLDRYS